MDDYRIEREIDIAAPVDVVWRTITDPEQIPRWFSDRAELDARPGGHGTLVFRADGPGEPHVVELTVVTADPPHVLAYRWLAPAGADATAQNSMLVTFTLRADGPERTHLRVEETGLEDLPWPDDEKRAYVDDHRDGWNEHGDRLRALFASGAG